ncbi:DUF805 domain-containing protein [Paracoccus sp. Z330]|uniref:DUF805 domain-containing protein n=1 Tax=Paracoccus onchidii TaxID=3017813 RepID=A0ABT4ZLP9_9RHOB|nr:DUF805 domain-containing protein [Paracoccus onchidii]MDB6179686.1 DUF805 domain-containing protein [Paracoccus onchidii]
MQNAVRNVLKHYASFSGRAKRPEYWWWVLFVFLLLLAARLIDYSVIMPLLGATSDQRPNSQPLSVMVALATLLPTLAVGARCLHDTGRSGWWLLVGLVPVVGILVLLYFFLKPNAEENR